jgi:hypothetical protein
MPPHRQQPIALLNAISQPRIQSKWTSTSQVLAIYSAETEARPEITPLSSKSGVKLSTETALEN